MFLSGCSVELLSPKGDIGAQEKSLFLTAFALMLVVVVPVIFMTVFFAWKYRDSNTKAIYKPNWSHSAAIESVVWTLPCIIVTILGIFAWNTSHTLDPYQSINSTLKPITIEVVSLDWKWLFIYPEHNIASVNEIAFPINTPLKFRITSDSVMNAFFIPQLGSQIYSMAGMETKLHLIAREPGTYSGISSNYSGEGFSGMHFKALATSQSGFEEWLEQAGKSRQSLTQNSYKLLSKPSSNVPVTFYSSISPGIFDYLVHSKMHSKAASQTPQNKLIPF